MPKKWLAPSPTDGQAEELVDIALSWLQTNVLRLIVTRVIPLVVGSGVVTLVLAWLQDALGLDVDPAVVTGFVVTVMGGVVATAFAYVRNHAGATHLGEALLRLTELRSLGETVTGELGTFEPAQGRKIGKADGPATPVEPPLPPGVAGDDVKASGRKVG